MNGLGSLVLVVAASLPGAAARAASPIRYTNQGPTWTADKRKLFYEVDQGSQLIPLAWIKALRQADGKPFLDGSLGRYGFLPADDPAMKDDLPIGFTSTASEHGQMVGISCAACHTRDITVGPATYRMDGGPAIADFAPFARDLDVAMGRVHADAATFKSFAGAVLGSTAADAGAVEMLRADVDLWSTRYHVFIDKSLPREHPWGPSRMDAISLIYNRLAGLDIGAPPTYLIPQNIKMGRAPVRYPFLWNSGRQDITQWTGFAANGSDFYALTRNLGEEYGVFGTFHPQPTTATFTILNRNYIAENSANMAGLKMSETLLREMGPPVWPFAVDHALSDKGKAIFERATAQGGCADCHGEKDGGPGPNGTRLFHTPVLDVGTDRSAWQVVMRDIDTGSMQGASLQGLVAPLAHRDMAISLLRAGVVGAIADDAKASPQVEAENAKTDNPKKRIADMAFDMVGLSVIRAQTAVKRSIGLGPPAPPPLVMNGYEARVLEGIWAAAPYLHNGSVPSLTELLKPASERTKSFKIGPEYDPAVIGLAANQTRFDTTLHTTGCDDLVSGDSNCGHEYGTHLPADDKKALLEYLKTL